MQYYHIEENISLEIEKNIPSGFGLGSSGASSSATVCALDKLFELEMTPDQKIFFAGSGEKAVSGTPHFDNASASILGGYTMVTALDPFHAINLRNETKFEFGVIMPNINIEKKTMISRQLLPKFIPFTIHMDSSRYLASLVTGITNDDENLIGDGMNDPIVEKSREKMYEFYRELKAEILQAGAYGVCLSGAGPSVLVISDGHINSDLNDITASVMDSYNLDFDILRGKIGRGVEIEGKILQ